MFYATGWWLFVLRYFVFLVFCFIFTAAERARELSYILTFAWFPPFVLLMFSEPTDLQSTGRRREEADPNLHPSPSPRCPSAKLCTLTTLRTRMSSASTLMTSSTSSKRVSVGTQWGFTELAVIFWWNRWNRALVCVGQMPPGGGQDGSVASRDYSPTTTWPRSRGCWSAAWGGEPDDPLWGRGRSLQSGSEALWTSHFLRGWIQWMYPSITSSDQKSVRLTKAGSASKTVQPRGLMFSTVPSSTEQNYLLYL